MVDTNSEKRQLMVKDQIAARGVHAKNVLKAFSHVPREKFVPERLVAQAYEDAAMSIGQEQTISQPYVVAYMTEMLDIKPTDSVLEIGTGSGYQTAILAELAKNVFTIERIESLSLTAQKVLGELKYKNIHFKIGDGYLGWPEEAPFDAIILTAAPTEIPKALIDQLEIGGRLIAPEGPITDQKLVLIKKMANGIDKKDLLSVRFVPMIPET